MHVNGKIKNDYWIKVFQRNQLFCCSINTFSEATLGNLPFPERCLCDLQDACYATGHEPLPT